MKKILGWLLLLLLGVATGGAAAFGTALLTGPHVAKPKEAPTAFLATGQILAPMVFADGRLAGYVNFDTQIEVPADQENVLKERLPVLLNAVNMRTYRTPMASGPDGLLPGVEQFRRVLMDAANESFGKENVRKVMVTQATPA
jgi:hypothetical protein